MEGEPDADRLGADASVEGVLDRLPDKRSDMTIVELVVARADEKLLLERIGLDRPRRPFRELPRQLCLESCCHACPRKRPRRRFRHLRPIRAPRCRCPAAVALLPQCQGGPSPVKPPASTAGMRLIGRREGTRRSRSSPLEPGGERPVRGPRWLGAEGLLEEGLAARERGRSRCFPWMSPLDAPPPSSRMYRRRLTSIMRLETRRSRP